MEPVKFLYKARKVSYRSRSVRLLMEEFQDGALDIDSVTALVR